MIIPREIEYVKQRDDWDCGVAVLAMVSGLTYEQVLDDFNGKGIEGVGIGGVLFDWWFVKHGVATQGKTPELDDPWPPEPWAPVHIAYVRATQGAHVCVMDCQGRVFDPFDIKRRTLTHKDYKRVRGVIGIWDIEELTR